MIILIWVSKGLSRQLNSVHKFDQDKDMYYIYAWAKADLCVIETIWAGKIL